VTNENRDPEPPADKYPVEARPPLHAPKVHTMGLGHIPLTALVTGSVSFIYAVAFHLGTAPPVASMAMLVALYILAAIVPSPHRLNPETDAAPAKLTTGTRFTIVRVAVACMLGGIAALPSGTPPVEALLWSLTAFGLAAALLEATDNWLARITGSVSSFSERLSVMTGSFFAFALALLPLQLGLIGPWVLAAGVFGFADAAISPRGPKGEIPPWQIWSRLAQRVALLAILVPWMPLWARTILAGAAILIALGHVIHALQTRISAAKQQNRPISDA